MSIISVEMGHRIHREILETLIFEMQVRAVSVTSGANVSDFFARFDRLTQLYEGLGTMGIESLKGLVVDDDSDAVTMLAADEFHGTGLGGENFFIGLRKDIDSFMTATRAGAEFRFDAAVFERPFDLSVLTVEPRARTIFIKIIFG